jgi:hypothetical protein
MHRVTLVTKSVDSYVRRPVSSARFLPDDEDERGFSKARARLIKARGLVDKAGGLHAMVDDLSSVLSTAQAVTIKASVTAAHAFASQAQVRVMRADAIY